jgi:uncharacterized cupin superfamily protein
VWAVRPSPDNEPVSVNIFDPQFDEERDWDGFRAHRARIGRQLRTERIGASFWELPPGEAAYPYHYHLAEEELLVILSGRPALRTPDGWRDLEPGEAVSFPTGENGAHQLVNRGDEPVRFVAVSTQSGPDVVIQPDSDKVGAFERRPEGGGLRVWFRREDEVGYMEGESRPEP